MDKKNLNDGSLKACMLVMQGAGLPSSVTGTFARLFDLMACGATGEITEEEIEPVHDLALYEELISHERYLSGGEKALRQLVVCKLNGGLGTGMGLEAAKSLLVVKDGLSFNEINARQVEFYSRKVGIAIPFINMTSFSTDEDIRTFARKFSHLSAGFPATFVQHKHPKVYADSLAPACEKRDELNWSPPGHGDIYAALVSSGLLEKLLSAGKRYLFVSNADNTGAAPDAAILGYIAEHAIPFLMEVALRTPMDSKGGHLARRKRDGRLILREGAQAPKDERGEPIADFQDVKKYRYFNTNSLWIDLKALRRVLDENNGIFPLPLIRNEKTVDPRNPQSRRVYQIETAMGAAIEVFDGARALVVPRLRFAPVKANNDLLVVRSDVYELCQDGRIFVTAARKSKQPPVVRLDPKYYKLIDDFEERFRVIPSLKNADTLKVEGNIVFDHPIALSGDVEIIDGRPEAERTRPAAVACSLAEIKGRRCIVTAAESRLTAL